MIFLEKSSTMKKGVLLLVFIGMVNTIFSQTKTVLTSKPVTTTSFQTAFFIKNVDSLRKERLIMDSMLRVNSRLVDTAYTRIDRFNAVISYCNSHNKGCADSVNAIVRKFDKETQELNLLNRELEKHIDFFNGLFPRVSNRLQKFAEENSTTTKTVQIDWSTYMEVHNEFTNWGNHIIREYNLNVSNMNSIKDMINGAIESMKR